MIVQFVQADDQAALELAKLWAHKIVKVPAGWECFRDTEEYKSWQEKK